jgi:hypothetical protein
MVFFPLYVRRRTSWGARPLLGYVLVAVIFFIGAQFARPLLGADRVRAYVSCSAAGETLRSGLKCSVKHTAGLYSAEVCWDVFLTCANGPGGTGHGCAVVAPGRTAEVAIPYSELAGVQGCDRVTKAELQNIVVNE